MAPFETRSRPTSFTSSIRPSPTVTPRASAIDSKTESNPNASELQVSPQAVSHENQSFASNGQAEPRRHPESETTLPHPCKTSSEPELSTHSPNTAAETSIHEGETVPSEQHSDSLPLSGVGMEADGNVTEPGKIMTLITVLKTNSGDLSHGQDEHRQSAEESSLAASVQGKFHWA